MMRASGQRACRRAATSMPLMSGRRRSMSVTSGFWASKVLMASSPLCASPTTVMSFWVPMIAASPCRTTGWSSTRRMRMTPLLSIGSSACLLQRERLCGHDDAHLGAAAGRASHLERRPDLAGALAHSQQAEMAGPRGVAGVEAAAVVARDQRERLVLVAQLDVDVGGLAVLDGIGDGLLADPQQVVLHGQREGTRVAHDARRDLDRFGAAARELLSDLAEGGRQAARAQR